MADHQDLVAASAHVVGYVQAADPGAIGAGKVWVDTTDGILNYRMFVRNSGDTGWEAVERETSYMLTITTTDAVATELLMGGAGGNQMVLPDDTTWFFEIHLAARRTDVDNESAGYIARGVIDRNAGVTALVGAVTYVYTNEDVGAWAITVDADAPNDALRIRGTGAAGSTVDWKAKVFITEVTG
jgi:hypothetical protein